jgi:hypothetical protein
MIVTHRYVESERLLESASKVIPLEEKMSELLRCESLQPLFKVR